MAYKVAYKEWLKTEYERVSSIVLMPKFWKKEWPPESLKEVLRDIGLTYSDSEIQEIHAELVSKGILEDV